MDINHNGIVDELTSGNWVNPTTKKNISIPIKKIEILESTNGLEFDLINKVHKNKKILIISDLNTHDILGSNIYQNLKGKLDVSEYIWKNPSSDSKNIEEIQNASKDYSALIAIGSGTICDSVKYVSFLEKKEYSVFATSPMNAYTSFNASISFDGEKKSISAIPPKGVFFDLSVISNCPKRLISAGFADVICRTTSQVDWLFSNILFKTFYDETPYYLLNLYEEQAINRATDIKNGEVNALSLLIKLTVLMGIGTMITGTSHLGSMAEHNISHFLDMCSKEKHSNTSHGEQVGIASVTISKIQNKIFNLNSPPKIYPTIIPEKKLIEIYGNLIYQKIKNQIKKKALDEKKTIIINNFLEENWEDIKIKIKKVMLPYNKLWDSLGNCGSLRLPKEGNIDINLYKDAIKYGRFIRDRYTILDFAGDSNMLEEFI